jgi:hypothetical protein
VILPPIQLYEIGGLYFVRDGNHRVSVAKAQGVETIDAEVTSLTSTITLEPGMTIDQTRKTVIAFEKKNFYAKTRFLEITGDDKLDFSICGQYDVIYNHILGHKYYMNIGIDGELPFDSALRSWYETVYMPVIQVIREEKLLPRFPGRTESDLYVWIVKHWDYLKKKYGAYSLQDAANDFTDKHGQVKGIWMYLLSRLKKD